MSREELPKALAKWYDYTKWVLDRVDGFPKNQRLEYLMKPEKEFRKKFIGLQQR